MSEHENTPNPLQTPEAQLLTAFSLARLSQARAVLLLGIIQAVTVH